jgi:hypothetical protein
LLWYATTVITNYQKREGKIKTIAPEGAILTDTLDKLIIAATNLKKDTGGFNSKLCKHYYDLVRTVYNNTMHPTLVAMIDYHQKSSKS